MTGRLEATMTSFTIHTPDTSPEGSKAILEQAKKGLGFVPNLYAVLAESPAALKAYTSYSEVLQGTDFTAEERNLLWLAISRTNGCEYCVAAHSALSGMAKVSDTNIQAIRNGLPLADAKLQALRRFTEVVVDSRGWAPESEVEAFLAAGFSRRQIIEVVAFISHKTLSNYLNHLAETPLDTAFVPHVWALDSARA